MKNIIIIIVKEPFAQYVWIRDRWWRGGGGVGDKGARTGFVPVGCRIRGREGLPLCSAFQRGRETVNLMAVVVVVAVEDNVRQYDARHRYRDKRHLTELIPKRPPQPPSRDLSASDRHHHSYSTASPRHPPTDNLFTHTHHTPVFGA